MQLTHIALAVTAAFLLALVRRHKNQPATVTQPAPAKRRQPPRVKTNG